MTSRRSSGTPRAGHILQLGKKTNKDAVEWMNNARAVQGKRHDSFIAALAPSPYNCCLLPALSLSSPSRSCLNRKHTIDDEGMRTGTQRRVRNPQNAIQKRDSNRDN